MDQAQPQAADEKPDIQNTLENTAELLSRLERVVRASNKDSMEVARGQREMQQTVQALRERMDDLELQIKGLTQESLQAAQKSQELSQTAKVHFAEALRDLEKRIKEDMQWEFNRATALAVFPALNDLDLVIEQQRLLNGGEDDSLLEAVEMVRGKFDQALQKLGWRQIEIKIGETKFDPRSA